MNKLKGKYSILGFSFTGGVILFFSAILFSGFFITNEKKYFLYIAVYDTQAATNHIVHLKRISFDATSSGGMENVMDVITQGADEHVPKIRFDLGPNKIYRNRWVITAYGNVIDLQQKKVLVDTHDQFVRASGDSIIFYTNDIMRGKFYSVLDLKTGNYAEVKSLTFHALLGQDVQPDCTTKNFKIYYYPPASEKVELVRDAGYGEDVSLIPKTKPQCPIYWIDNDNFLYPNYSSGQDYVAIMKVNFTSKEQEKIGDIDQLPENHSLSKFHKTAENEIIYQCARGYFKIDLNKRKVSELQFLSAGNGFSVSIAEVDIKGRQIMKDNQVLGTYFCLPELASTTTGHIAFPYEIVLSNEHYLQGAAVYSESTHQWKTIGDSDLSAVIGWTEE